MAALTAASSIGDTTAAFTAETSGEKVVSIPLSTSGGSDTYTDAHLINVGVKTWAVAQNAGANYVNVQSYAPTTGQFVIGSSGAAVFELIIWMSN